jgi:hypothetical protein
MQPQRTSQHDMFIFNKQTQVLTQAKPGRSSLHNIFEHKHLALLF